MQFACNKIDYFIGEIVVREPMSIRLSKYIAAFDYVDKALPVLSATAAFDYVDKALPVLSATSGVVSVASVSLGSVLLSVMELKKNLNQEKRKRNSKIVFIAGS